MPVRADHFYSGAFNYEQDGVQRKSLVFLGYGKAGAPQSFVKNRCRQLHRLACDAVNFGKLLALRAAQTADKRPARNSTFSPRSSSRKCLLFRLTSL